MFLEKHLSSYLNKALKRNLKTVALVLFRSRLYPDFDLEAAAQFGEVMKFKVGDKVVRTIEGFWGKGRRAVIIRKCPDCKKDWVVDVSNTDHVINVINWSEDCMVLEDVYNSPLYQALK